MTTSPDARRRSDRWVIAGLIFAVGVAGWLGWYLAFPERFRPVGNELRVQMTVGQPLVVSVRAWPAAGEVTLRSARPRIVENTADAEIKTFFCAVRPGFTAERASARAVCGTDTSVSGRQLGWTAGHVVLEVIARRPGKVIVDGIDLAYSAGVRRGNETTGSGIVVEVTAR